MEKERAPWWLWPNLLSIDAPLAAVAWAWMFAKAWGVVSVPWQLWVALGLMVWRKKVSGSCLRALDAARLAFGRGDRPVVTEENKERVLRKTAAIELPMVLTPELMCRLGRLIIKRV